MKMIPLIVVSVWIGFCGCEPSRNAEVPRPASSAKTDVIQIPTFDGQKAYSFLVEQTKFGPRNPGSTGHNRCLDYITTTLRQYADSVAVLRFRATTFDGATYEGYNVFARFKPTATERILLSAHWDTRPKADQDPDPKKRSTPIQGANDGASGVAVLLELARAMSSAPPPNGVDIVLFDLEDSGESGYSDSWSLGAQYFAAQNLKADLYQYAINLDMVGDANLEIRRESNSDRYAPQVNDLVFSTAKLLNVYQFIDEPGHQIQDDHIPLNEAGLPTVDIIDFDYPDSNHEYWHTTDDTADKCSPESLEAVGTVVTQIIYGQARDH